MLKNTYKCHKMPYSLKFKRQITYKLLNNYLKPDDRKKVI